MSAEMDDNKAIIDSLKKKVSRIIEDNRRLRSEVRELTAERDTVILEKRAAETEIRQLGRRIETLETAGLMGNRGDSRIARLRVNKLLREIDKCLALMNK
mgnify:CR=1 FL=1